MATLKIVHLLFLFIWLGALLSLSRLLASIKNEEASVKTALLRICRRTYLLIELPAMVIALSTGISLLILKGVDMKAGWFHMKMTFMLFLVIIDILLARSLFRTPFQGARRFKILHYVALLSLVAILISVYILKK